MSIAADSYMSLNKTIKCNQLSHHCDFELLTIDIRSKNVISNQRGKGNKNLGNDQKNASKKLLAAEFDGLGQFLPFTFEGHLEGAT